LPGDASDAEIKELKRSPELELDYKLWHRVRPSYLTNEEVKELLARGAKGVEELRSSLRRMSSVPVGGPRFR
jgi:hypothetical protein